MTTEKLYDTIKSWHDSCDTAGLYLVANDMNITLKQLEADMLIERFSVLNNPIRRSYNRLCTGFL